MDDYPKCIVTKFLEKYNFTIADVDENGNLCIKMKMNI